MSCCDVSVLHRLLPLFYPRGLRCVLMTATSVDIYFWYLFIHLISVVWKVLNSGSALTGMKLLVQYEMYILSNILTFKD